MLGSSLPGGGIVNQIGRDLIMPVSSWPAEAQEERGNLPAHTSCYAR
jgi:hypothetical protein